MYAIRSYYDTLYTNDLNNGPFISDTLRLDETREVLDAQVEIYRMMRPGEPPTKEAAQTIRSSGTMAFPSAST